MIPILKNTENRITKASLKYLLAIAIFLIPGFFTAFAAQSDIEKQPVSNVPDGYVADASGRRVDVRRPFSKIISLYGAHTENLFALGLDQEIIGVSPNEAYPPEAHEKPIFSYREDPEKFLAARPDLVLIRPMIESGYPKLVSRLQDSGITVVSLQPGTVDDMYVCWEILGALTGKRDRSLEMIREFRDKTENIRRITSRIEPKKKVYFEAVHKRMKTFAPEAMAMFVLETAGGVNIATDAKQVRKTNIAQYGKEKILARGDDIDAYIAQFGVMNGPTVSSIRNEPGFSAIKAIRENRILIIDETIVSRPTMRLISGIMEISQFLYPGMLEAMSPTGQEKVPE